MDKIFIQTRDGDATDVTMQDLINALCYILDGVQCHDLGDMTGLSEEECDRLDTIRNVARQHWKYYDGRFVVA